MSDDALKAVASLFPDPFAGPPDHVNDEGFKWWCDRDLTRCAVKEDLHGTALPGVSVWFVEHPKTGYRERVILDTDGTVEYHTTKLEDAAVHLDMMKVAKRYSDEEAALRLTQGAASDPVTTTST